MTINTKILKLKDNNTKLLILKPEVQGAIENLSIVFPNSTKAPRHVTIYIKDENGNENILFYNVPVDSNGFHLGRYYFQENVSFSIEAHDLEDGDEIHITVQYKLFY
jgi:hypothetical protein